MELMADMESMVVSLGASWWLLGIVALLVAVDGFFPPVPSESLIIAVSVLAVTGVGPSLWGLAAAAASGALAGDVIAYTIGTKVPVERMRVIRGRRARAALDHVTRSLARRGTVVILSGRFVPVGRVAVNLTAGAVGYPRARFVGIDVVAACVWAAYSVLIGAAAGRLLHEHTLIAIAGGVLGGVLVGICLDKLRGVGHRLWCGRGAGPAEVITAPRVVRDGTAGPTARPRGAGGGRRRPAGGAGSGAALTARHDRDDQRPGAPWPR